MNLLIEFIVIFNSSPWIDAYVSEKPATTDLNYLIFSF